MTFPHFAWGSGEECSAPTVLHEGRVVRVDEMESTGHYRNLDLDLSLAAGLGVDVWRYGIPWHRVEKAPGEYDWELWDRALARCEVEGLVPVVDLCHFGLPDHYGGFSEPGWVDGLIRYAEAFLARYPEPTLFTPVNEPLATAGVSCLYGHWNDRVSDVDAYGRALAHCIRADLEVAAMVRSDRDGWNISAEVFLVPVVLDETARAAAEKLSARVRAPWDLRFGREVDPLVAHEFRSVPEAEMTRIAELAGTGNFIAGHDFYPTSALPMGRENGIQLDIEDRLDAYVGAALDFHDRYGVDFWVSETSCLGLGPERAEEWLGGMATRLRAMAAEGVGVRGLCWYSRGDQHDWDTMLVPPIHQVTEVGLFDLERHERPVAGLFRQLAAEDRRS